MTPAQLKKANTERFERLIAAEPSADKRRALKDSLARERARPLVEYPAGAQGRDDR